MGEYCFSYLNDCSSSWGKSQKGLLQLHVPHNRVIIISSMQNTVRNASLAPVSRGFTIVELLIVIVVIGILAAIVIVAYNGISQRAAEVSYKNAAASILKKAEVYRATRGVYPGTAADNGQSIDFYTGVSNPDIAAQLPNGLKAFYYDESSVGAPLTTSTYPYTTLKSAADGTFAAFPSTKTYVVATCTGGNGYKIVYPNPKDSTVVMLTTGTGC